MNIFRPLIFSCIALVFVGCTADIGSPPASPDAGATDPGIKSRTEPGDPKLAELSQLLKSIWGSGKMTKEEKLELTELLEIILPTQEYIGDDKEWKINAHANLIELNLMSKDGKERFMWLHVLYKTDEVKSYGSENFGDYRGMGAGNQHYFILVGNLELRAVADSDEYRDDVKIKEMLWAFSLKAISEL